MEWYNGAGIDELVVPKAREESDKLLSSESLLQWGMQAPESFWLPEKYFIPEQVKHVDERNFMGESLSNEEETDLFGQERDRSASSSLCGGSSEALIQRGMVLNDWPDHQLDDLEAIDEMDDIFLSSLLQDLPVTEDSSESFSFSSSYDMARNTNGLSSSKHLKTHGLATSVNWEVKELASSHFVPSIKSPVKKAMVPSMQSIANGQTNDETSEEEFVLQELGTVMELMTDETRLCFRDALYRLSNNSKQFAQNHTQQDNLASSNVHKSVDYIKTARACTPEAFELETNIIDRAVANLMSNKMQLNSQELPTKQEIVPTTKGPLNYASYQSKIHHFQHYKTLSSDAQVPIFCHEI